MVPVGPVPVAVTIVHARETTVEPAAMKRAGVKSAPVKPAAMKPAGVKSATVKPTKSAAMKSATAVETPSSTPAPCVGEAWLAENSHAEQRSGNAHYTPPFARLGSAVA
jgi:hypothetical protein